MLIYSKPEKYGFGHLSRMRSLQREMSEIESTLVSDDKISSLSNSDSFDTVAIDVWKLHQRLVKEAKNKSGGGLVVYNERRQFGFCKNLSSQDAVVSGQHYFHFWRGEKAHILCHHKQLLGSEFWNQRPNEIISLTSRKIDPPILGVVLGTSKIGTRRLLKSIGKSISRLGENHSNLRVRFHIVSGEHDDLVEAQLHHMSDRVVFSNQKQEVSQTLKLSDLLILSGGYTKNDTSNAFAKFTLALHPHQIRLCRAFESAGEGIYLGFGALLSSKILERRLAVALEKALTGKIMCSRTGKN